MTSSFFKLQPKCAKLSLKSNFLLIDEHIGCVSPKCKVWQPNVLLVSHLRKLLTLNWAAIIHNVGAPC